MLLLWVPSGLRRTGSSPPKGFYTPKSFIIHAASLRQAFAHCARFPTAASRRSLGRISVPVWPATLSGRLSIGALVSHYLTNKLMDRGPIPQRPKPLIFWRCRQKMLFGIRPSFEGLSPTEGQVAHVLRTVRRFTLPRKRGISRSTCMYEARRQRSF